MKDFLSESLEYISEDLLAECDEYVAELLAKKEKRARRRKMLALWMRAGASAALVIAIVVTGFWAGWEKLNPKTSGLAYTVYDSFQEAAMVIGENTLLSRLPAMETETVAVYDDSSADNTGTWADVVCNGIGQDCEILFSYAQNKSPLWDEALCIDSITEERIQKISIGTVNVQYVIFPIGVFSKKNCTVVLAFLYEDILYQLQFSTDRDADQTVFWALSYLENLLTDH